MLAIARALMLRPRVLALDEPTANLSPKLAASILQEHVRRLAADGVAIVLVEQRATLALEIADWAYVLVAGSIRLSGPAADILAREDLGEIFLGRDPNLAATGVEGET
jgi:ABC-type branched-subunit amino acid transport system ATPase component